MLDKKCDVCGEKEAIGVASTSVPFSCAFCLECAQQGADPEWIFEYYLDEVAGGDPSKIREGLTTYVNGKYVSFHDWARMKKEGC